MKKTSIVSIIIILLIILLIFLSLYISHKNKNVFGNYSFKEVTYLSPLSSSTKNYFQDEMKDSNYLILEDLFKIESKRYNVEYDFPKYKKEKISTNSSVFSDVNSFIGNNVKYQYTIYDKDGNETNWRLYVSSNSLWIGYYNNTINNSDIIMHIFNLSKENK